MSKQHVKLQFFICPHNKKKIKCNKRFKFLCNLSAHWKRKHGTDVMPTNKKKVIRTTKKMPINIIGERIYYDYKKNDKK